MLARCLYRHTGNGLRYPRWRCGRFAAIFVALLLGAGVVVSGQRPDTAPFVVARSGSIALTHVSVVDGTGAPVKPDHTVILEGDRIATVGPSATTGVPVDAEVFDLSNHTLLPGLVGLHAHTYFGGLRSATQMAVTGPLLYLAYGVTTAMTAGSQLPYHELNMKRSVDTGETPGPDFHIAGPYLDGEPARLFARQVSTPAAARRIIEYWAAEGATWVKFLGRVKRDVLRAGIQEAHSRGLRVSGHLCSVTFTEAIELGIDLLQHGFLMNTDYVEDKVVDECPADYSSMYESVDLENPAVQSSIRTIATSTAAVVSTLAVYETFVPGRAFLDPRALGMLHPTTRQEVEAKHGDPERWDTQLSPTLFEKMMAWEREFVGAGGLLGAGADPWDSGVLPGLGNIRQYELLVEAGFEPENAVRIMTMNGARILGLEGDIGSVAEGKRADLFVVSGDPIRSPADLYDVVAVFKDGVGYDPVALRDAAKGRVGVD